MKKGGFDTNKKRMLLTIIILIAIVTVISLFSSHKDKEQMISEELLKIDNIEYIRVDIPGEEEINIKETEKVHEVISLLQQLNGKIELKTLPQGDEPILGIHIALEGYYPSAAIAVYEDAIYYGGGRSAPKERVNQLVSSIKSNHDK
jgi:hypothetical protein